MLRTDEGRTRRGVKRTPAMEGLEERRLLTSLPMNGIVSLIEFTPNSSRSILESEVRQVFAVRRTGDLSGTATVRVRTEPGTALAGYDYQSFETILTFGPGESQKTFVVNVIDDKIAETPFKAFTVVLSQPTGGAGLAQHSVATVFIQDDEPASMQPLMLLDYGAFGTWTYDTVQGFRKIADVNPQAVVASANRMGYLDRGADGLWAWDSLRGLRQISAADPESIVVINNDSTRAEDVLLVDFGPSGLWRFSESQGWRQLSEVDPRSIVIDRQTAYIDFGHGGLWRWSDQTPWYQINTVAPDNIAVDAGAVFLDYGARGLWTWSVAAGWANISSGDPQSIALANGKYYANYGAAGVWLWTGSEGWNQILEAAPRSMLAVNDDLYVDYGEHGLWSFSVDTKEVWARRKLAETGVDAMVFSRRANQLFAMRRGSGLFAWYVRTVTGRQLHGMSPDSFSIA